VRVIAQSGPVGAEPSLAESEKRGVDFAAELGFTGEEALAKLRAVPDTELMEKAGQNEGPGMGMGTWTAGCFRSQPRRSMPKAASKRWRC
jgi:carboxylesterase type B